MNYPDWKAVYIDKTQTLEQWQLKKSANRDTILTQSLSVNKLSKEETPPLLIEKLGRVTDSVVNETLKHCEQMIVNAPIENGLVITRTGEIYHCTGTLNALDNIVTLGDKLKGATVTHNHPIDSDNEYTFSHLDFCLFRDYGLNRLRGIDERYIYEFNRNPEDVDAIMAIGDVVLDNFWHASNMVKAKLNGFGYRRWER